MINLVILFAFIDVRRVIRLLFRCCKGSIAAAKTQKRSINASKYSANETASSAQFLMDRNDDNYYNSWCATFRSKI